MWMLMLMGDLIREAGSLMKCGWGYSKVSRLKLRLAALFFGSKEQDLSLGFHALNLTILSLLLLHISLTTLYNH